MQKNRAERPPNGIRTCLSLLLIAAVVLSGCGGKDTPAPKPTTAPTRAPTTAPTRAPTSAPTTAPTAPAVISGNTIAISTGGSIIIPEGALPKGTEVEVMATHMPTLPDDVKAVGDAILITAAAQPTEPVTLRLPIPEGAANPSELAIVRVEGDGTTTFLMTRAEGNELVAETPGFSAFARVRIPSALPLKLRGKERLLPGELHTYLLDHPDPEARVSTSWVASGRGTLVSQGDTAATIRAGDEEGSVNLICSCSEQPTGRNWWGSIRIRVVDPGVSPDKFSVSVIARPAVAYIGKDTVRVAAAVHGNYQTPLTWTWELENGAKGGPVTTPAGTTEFELPAADLPGLDQPGTHVLSVWARDFQDRVYAGLGQYVLKVEPLSLAVDGPHYVDRPGAYEAYTALCGGGAPPYVYSFVLFPGPKRRVDSGNTPTATFLFDQPGAHRLEVTCRDNEGTMAVTSRQITVEGGEALSARIIDLPATAAVNREVEMTVSLRGGVLVVSGKKSDYNVFVYWADSSLPYVQKDVSASTPDEGVTLPLSHKWAEPKTYVVFLAVWDAAGNVASDSRQITITDAAPTASPTATAKAVPKATATATAAAGLLVWVRQEPAVVNANKDPLEFQSPEPRFAGSFSKITPSETSFTTQEKYVDHGAEFYNVSITCKFDTPPLVLNPGLRYKVQVSCSNGGSNPGGEQSLGERFWYSAQKGYEAIIEPREVINYFPWSTAFDGASTKEWMIAAPPARRLGDTFQIYAGLWNRPPCNVTWTYKAEYH